MRLRGVLREAIHQVLLETEEDVMEPTVEWMTAKYNEFNQTLFDGKLPKCKLEVSDLPDNEAGTFRRSKSALGKCLTSLGAALIAVGDNYAPLNTKTYYRYIRPCIILNSKYARSERDLENTLIHEMCHYYCCFDEKGDARSIDSANRGHGDDFNAAAAMVSQKTNGAVTINAIEGAEALETLHATKSFNKDGMMVGLFDYGGEKCICYAKGDIMVSYKKVWGDLRCSDDPHLIMILKRYGYKVSTLKTLMSKRHINGYLIKENTPEAVRKAVEDANFDIEI